MKLFILIILYILTGCTCVISAPPKAETQTFISSSGSIQTIYQNGVPHTDKNGQIMTEFDEQDSFFPIWMYGQMHPSTSYLCHPDESTKKWDEYNPTSTTRWSNIRILKDANFNTAQHWGYPWEFSNTLLNEANRLGLQVIEYWQPLDSYDHSVNNTIIQQYEWDSWGSFDTLDDYVTTNYQHPNILGYIPTEETGRYFSLSARTPEQWIFHFRDIKQEINAITNRPVFVLDNLWVTNQTEITLENDPTGGLDAWLYWHNNVDNGISALDVYVQNLSTIDTFDYSRGLNRAGKFITDTYNESRPYWVMLNVFEDGSSYQFPTNSQLRTMVYTSIIHGATGIAYFGADSYALRLAGLVGVRPDTPTTYLKSTNGVNTYCGDVFPNETFIEIDNTKAAQSISLWNKISSVNSELNDLRSVILSPTSTLNYTVEISGTPISTIPIRTLLKEYNGYYYLFAVNLDKTDISVRITLPGVINSQGEVLYESRSKTTDNYNKFVDDFDDFDVHIYKFQIP